MRACDELASCHQEIARRGERDELPGGGDPVAAGGEAQDRVSLP
jgi:hypothetical protein